MNNIKLGVIVLAAGRGSRMNSEIPKQYMDINGYPVLYYSLKCFEEYEIVNKIVVVTSPEDISMVQTDIVGKYNFSKVFDVVAGGKERYDSVYNALQCIGNVDYVMIHDGARPCITHRVLDRLMEEVISVKACVPAVPSKDTVRITDDRGYVTMTPDRSCVWNIQTPQTFEMKGIYNAYKNYFDSGKAFHVTDDAMLWEKYDGRRIKLVMGDYVNFKITTPEDMVALANHLSEGNEQNME
ncbi:MAG: 2-C-methyl-D-erythritol 4-phosphate cytidylyltransferase [Lachnospiraceae bacterium]|nr:2-C-methyl-D-erythritol 4-phosphate cytidylyltransferase [Lachnospiraceae bacterium]